MDHPCSKCGASVEDGIPFCPACGQPQIRVLLPGTAAATVPMPPGTPDDIQPPSEPLSPHMGRLGTQRAPLGWASDPTGEMREALTVRQNMRRAALIAGVIGGFAGAIPIPGASILIVVAAGGIAVTLFHRRAPGVQIPTKMGWRLGAMAGFFTWLTIQVFQALTLLSRTGRELFRQQIVQGMAQTQDLYQRMGITPDAAAMESMKKTAEYISTPQGMFLYLLLTAFVLFLVLGVLGGVGGAIGATLFGRHPHHD